MARMSSRPLSPHLSIWKMGIHMFVSILNRVMGVGLAVVGVAMLVWGLVAAASGRESYAVFFTVATSWFGYLVGIGLSFAAAYHFLGGIRHFVLDVGAGYELKANRNWAWATLAGSVVITAAIWFTVFAKGMN